MKTRSSDEFQTPAVAINCLLPYLPKEWIIWECAMGKGNITNYLLENGFKRWIKDEASFNKLGYKWSDIKVIEDNEIVYPNGIDLEVIKSAFIFTKVLKPRSTGSDVIQLQTILKKLKYFTYSRITSFYGQQTYNAVIKFQKANKLKATGIVDKATMNKLNSLLLD